MIGNRALEGNPIPARKALETAYSRTTYRVLTAEVPIDIRIGETNDALDRLLKIRQVREWVFVSASNPRSKQLCDAENAHRNGAMKRLLAQYGCEYVDAVGIPDESGWPAEHSVFIFGMNKVDGSSLGKRFGQNAVVHGVLEAAAELVWIE